MVVESKMVYIPSTPMSQPLITSPTPAGNVSLKLTLIRFLRGHDTIRKKTYLA
jgi:hypothetical protein